ncbi:MAG TPA: malto-oligosyltrehalose trehalohydrolase [Acidimicrobiales bacterium]|nr:malto-oligosyltrehalose trehalohydrolase [Acidimicrobiales bacterium]
MITFELWAPGAGSVEVVFEGDQRHPLARSGRGWWRAEVPGTGHGTRYRFSVDGRPPRPDPRSAWQPDGVDGASAVVEHHLYSWEDAGWRGLPLEQAVIYECHVGTFSEKGTFEGALDRIDHLVGLGVNAVELLPVAEASGSRGWGYDGADLWAPHHSYGGPHGLKAFVDGCHQQGLAVVLDVVYNHLGPAGNYLSEFGPYFTDRYRTPWGQAVNVDGEGSYGVREFIVSNALMWLRDYHIDGLRLDAVHAIYDEGSLHVLEQLAAAVDDLEPEVGRELWLIAESDRNDPRIVRARAEHGYGIDASWTDDFHHSVHTVLTGERNGYYMDFGRVRDIAKAFENGYVYDGEFSEFRRRFHGRPADDLPGRSFVVAVQNHDQVGNRALGERLGALVPFEALYAAAALLVLSPFVPMLFQGEEWGASSPFQYFTDHQDPELGRAVSEGRRREHAIDGALQDGREVPDPQAVETFDRSKLEWSEVYEEPHRSLLDWYRRLIELRRAHPELGCSDRYNVATTYDEDLRWLIVRRGPFDLLVNLAPERQLVPYAGDGAVVLAGPGPAEPGDGSAAGNGHTASGFWLGPYAAAVIR